MFTLARRKFLPIILLILMLIIFFLPEFGMISNYLGDSVFRSFNNPKYYVELVSPDHSSYGFPENATVVFKTNLDLNQIDFSRSTISIFSQEFGRHTYNLQTEYFDVIEKEDATYVTYTQKEAIPENFTVYIDFNLKDVERVNYYTYIYSTRAPGFGDYFISRWSYLIQYIIWYIVVFGGAIRGLPWSVVYDSKTKQPVSSAIVRVFKEGHLYTTLISDVNGVVRIRLEKGKYTIQALREGYVFPSVLKPLRKDGEYADLYYGEEIHVSEVSKDLRSGIPIDPISIRREGLTRGLVTATISNLALINPFVLMAVSVIQVIMWPDTLYAWFSVIIAVILIFGQYLIKRQIYGQPGRMVDEKGQPITGIKVVLYEADWNKPVTFQITDMKGEYEFVVPAKEYYIKIENPDFVLVDADKDGKYQLAKHEKTTKTVRINERIVVRRTNSK